MSIHIQTPEYIGHADLEDPFEFVLPDNKKDSCEGEMTPENIWKNCQLVNRVWTCDCCGYNMLEDEFLRIIESRGLVAA